MKNDLPFSSRPSAQHPGVAAASATPNTPRAPDAPVAPPVRRLSQEQWKTYLRDMSVYMGQWHKFEGKILQHFAARHVQDERFGTGLPDPQATVLLEARGATKDGLEKLMQDMDQDRTIRDFWRSACARHQRGILEFQSVKAAVAKNGWA